MAFAKWDWRSHPAPRDTLQRAIMPRWKANDMPTRGSTPDDKAEYLDFLGFLAFEIKRWLDTLPEGAEIGTTDLMAAFVPDPTTLPSFYKALANRIGDARYHGLLDGYWHDVPNRRYKKQPFKKYHRRMP